MARTSAAETNDNFETENATSLVSKEGLRELLQGVVSAATTASAQSQAETLQALVSALLDSKKPYVDPLAVETQAIIRRMDEETEARKQANIKAAQERCPHQQGSSPLSEYAAPHTAIAKHRLDDRRIVGICLVCGRLWEPNDPDYAVWMNKKSGCRMSQAGLRG